MTPSLTDIITASDPALRNTSLDAVCRDHSLKELLEHCDHLEAFSRESDNLYERVRALFFLYAIYRFHVPLRPELPSTGTIPYDGYSYLLRRRFEEAIDLFLFTQKKEGPSDTIASALAAAYQALGFQTLANQVRRSVRSVRGNQWMFRTGHPADQPLRVRPEMMTGSGSEPYPRATRAHTGAHGPVAQCVERHLLSRHGFS